MNARLSPAVYRRRRLVVFGGGLVVLVLLISGIWALVAQPWRGAEGSQQTPGQGEPGDETEGPIGPCAASSILVEPVTDATSYPAGVMPQLSIRLTNTGGVDCTLNVGTSTQAFTVTSGSDLWWRSTDCQTESSDLQYTLEAGQTVTTTDPVEWNRERSSPSTCDSNRPKAPGGGASYHVSVEIGGFSSTTTKQILLH